MDKEIKSNREAKDSMFSLLFSKPENQVELCKALVPELGDVTAGDIQTVTLDHIMDVGVYNDLGLVVQDSLIALVEAQSTLPVNLAPRLFMYAGETYNRYIASRQLRIYGESKVMLPGCKGFVVYTGDRNCSRYLELRDSFIGGEGPSWRIPVINMKEAISAYRRSPNILWEYMLFCSIFDRVRKQGLSGDSLIKSVVRQCVSNNILKDILTTHYQEVLGVMSHEEKIRLIRLSVEGDARDKGRSEGRAEGQLDTAKMLLAMGGSSI